MMDEIDFIAEHPKADMSKVNTIRVNGKEYASIDRVLEIIDEDVGEHIYRDAFKSREDLTKLYDRVRSHVVALKGGEQV